MDKTFRHITDRKEGLPENRLKKKAILEQFNVGKYGNVNSGTLIFEDGQIYMLWSGGDQSQQQWKPFTRLKPEGLEELLNLIDKEFNKLDTKENYRGTAHNVLIWRSFRDGNETTIIRPSGPYSGLPPVFKKIEDSINRNMERLHQQK